MKNSGLKRTKIPKKLIEKSAASQTTSKTHKIPPNSSKLHNNKVKKKQDIKIWNFTKSIINSQETNQSIFKLTITKTCNNHARSLQGFNYIKLKTQYNPILTTLFSCLLRNKLACTLKYKSTDFVPIQHRNGEHDRHQRECWCGVEGRLVIQSLVDFTSSRSWLHHQLIVGGRDRRIVWKCRRLTLFCRREPPCRRLASVHGR